MIITRPGTDLLDVENKDFEEENIRKSDNKWHLIRINFKKPSVDMMDWLLQSYPRTNRFIITEDVKFYNWYFKPKKRKFYVENSKNDVGLFSFFKKNNKVLFNFNKLDKNLRDFVLQSKIFIDILDNCEIIEINEDIFASNADVLKEWKGNVVINTCYR